MSKNIILTCKEVCYCSSIDEDLFFEWIKRIPSIIKFDGIRDELYLYFENNNISDNDLSELLALFFRYAIDMKQLTVFLNDVNQEWFYENKEAYWYKHVFE